MQIGRIEGATREIGQSQGYLGLPLRDIEINCSVNGPDTPAMESAWLPNLDELARLAVGAPVILRVVGTSHPPVMIEVGSAPEGELAAPIAHLIDAAPDMLEALHKAESFIAGFEDDEMQDGIAEMLVGIRAALARAEGR